jgi:putative nucleotidyltransferase with HDIG domain
MLKKIPVDQARVGMFLHRLDGAWMDHPFWKTRFTISDPDDLARLCASAVKFCWIDNALGLDVGTAETIDLPRPRVPAPCSEPSRPSAAAAAPPAPASRSMSDELHQAAAVVNRGRRAVMTLFGEARMGQALDAEKCLPMVGEIADSVMRNPGALVSLARLKTQDDYSYMHSVAVCALMVSLARQIGMDDAACRDAGLAGLLHDLGKAAMPIAVLNKPGRLTEAEFDIMKTHPVRGHEMLLEARGAGPSVLEVCLHHHERPDGHGYPDGLAGDEVSLLARMGAVCDVYDAITSNRPYKSGWDPAESIAQMASWKGQFDDNLFQAFVRSLGIYPVGSLVRLASGRLAVVVEQNPGTLVMPIVKAFFSTKSNMPIAPVQLDLSRRGGSERIVGREAPDKWGFAKMDELWVDGEVLRRLK